MATKVEKYIHLINSLNNSTVEKIRPVLEHVGGEVIKLFCEMVYNILKGIVPITDKEMGRFRKLKHVFKKLTLKSVSIKKKRQIIIENIKSLKSIITPVLRYFTSSVHKNV